VKPAFLGIGAHKGGTTWLYRQLEAHPEIRFSTDGQGAGRIPVKERHFWCRALHDRRVRPRWPGPLDRALVAYLVSFPDGVITGEITPHYAVLDSAVISQVAESLPGVRLIYLLREPRARAWSSAVSSYAEIEAGTQGPGRTRRAEVWDAPLARESTVFDGRAEEWLRGRLTGSVALSHSDYASVVTRWRRYFPEEALLLATTDDISVDPRGLLRRVFRHVGADPGLADRMSDEDLAAWVNPHRPAPRVPVGLQAVLDETYLPLVEPLEHLTGWDLSRWKERPIEYGD
jgi:hypothetical protein